MYAIRSYYVIVGAMVGKLTKIAQGLSVTHAWREAVDRDLIAEAAREVGAPEALVEAVRAAETARFAAEQLGELGLAEAFHRALAVRAIRSLRSRYPGPHRLTVITSYSIHYTKLYEDSPARPAGRQKGEKTCPTIRLPRNR